MKPGGEHWDGMWRGLRVAPPTEWHERLLGCYAEAQRHYHTVQHLGEMLHEFAAARGLARNAPLVELAIWFHDAVYDPRALDNEERSAELAVKCLREANADESVGRAVAELVLATKHHVAATPDQALLIDADLAILGKPGERFAEYERQIREEYAWVPAALFAEKRAEVLQRFLERPRIYRTEYFFNRYEVPARANVTEAIERLRGKK